MSVLALVLISLSGCLQSSTLTETDRQLPETKQTGFNKDEVLINKNESYIAFTGTKNNFAASHQGEFENFDVTINLDSEDPHNLEKAQVDVMIDVTSMKTDSQGLTDHLLNPDFFESETYPKATFKSSTITKTGAKNYDLKGDLTIKDVTKSAVFNTEITNEYAVFKYDLNRLDFNVGSEGKVDNLVPLEVKLIFK